MTGPDASSDVVRTRKEAGSLNRPPLLILDALAAHLDDAGLGTGEIEWERIGEGQSNVTFLIRRVGLTAVLRRGPRPPHPPRTHDMVREARVLTTLREAGVPVPTVRDVCTDENVLGVPFYLMEFLDGHVITDTEPLPWRSSARRAEVSDAAVDALIALHRVDVADGPVSALGRPQGYLERQVATFTALWPRNTRRDVPAVTAVGEWLAANIPDSARASVVHGDFRIGNLMYATDRPRVRAILDWEMATLGDPLADLGYFVATYAEPGSPWSPMELTSVTREPGYLRREDLIARYQDALPFDERLLGWYQALALWKAAIFCEALYTRYLDGEMPGDAFRQRLKAGVPLLVDQAAELAGVRTR